MPGVSVTATNTTDRTQRANSGRLILAGLAVLLLVPDHPSPAASRDSSHPPEVPVVRLAPREPYQQVGDRMAFLLDRDSRLSVEDAMAADRQGRFRPVVGGFIRDSTPGDAVWLRIRVDASTWATHAEREPLLLLLDWPNHGSVQFFTTPPRPRGSFSPHSAVIAGDIPPGQGDDIARKPLLFPLPPSAHGIITCYLRIQSPWTVFVAASIGTTAAVHERLTARTLLFGAYYGTMLMLALTSLCVGLVVRDRRFLFNFVHVTALVLYFAGINGTVTQFFFPGCSDAAVRFTLSALGVSMVALILFVRSYLATACRTPTLDRLLLGLVGAGLSILAATPLVPPALASRGYQVLGVPYAILLALPGIAIARQGSRPARFFLVAWSVFSSGMLLYLFVFAGFIPFKSWTIHSFQGSSLVEVLVLSWGLADWIHALYRERETLHRNALAYRAMAHTDALTRLFNKRRFLQCLAEEVERANPPERPLSLLMLDIDDFKQLNDHYGHPQGDHVLAAVGSVLRQGLRATDVACRYGGEEFAVILPGTSWRIAREVAERVRRAIESQIFRTEAGLRFRITVSIGCAEYQARETPNQFVNRADRALYRAKSEGKNRTVLATTLSIIVGPEAAGQPEPR